MPTAPSRYVKMCYEKRCRRCCLNPSSLLSNRFKVEPTSMPRCSCSRHRCRYLSHYLRRRPLWSVTRSCHNLGNVILRRVDSQLACMSDFWSLRVTGAGRRGYMVLVRLRALLDTDRRQMDEHRLPSTPHPSQQIVFESPKAIDTRSEACS